MRRRFYRQLFLQALEHRATPDATAHALASSNFVQNWTNTGMITVDNDWNTVPSIIGYRGDDTIGTGVDPQTVLGDGTTTPVNVKANQADPNTFTSGGLAEFDTLANPAVGLQGSGTADAPFLLIHLDTQNVSSVNIQYTLRDLESSADNATQQVALQWRVGNSGNFTNVPAAYVADATTGPGTNGPDIPINVTLPAGADNQSLVQVRIITTNAVGSDEFVGVDDITISGTSGGNNVAPNNVLPPTQIMTQDQSLFLSSGTSNAIQVTDPDAGAGQMKINFKATNGKLTLSGNTGLTFSLGDGTDDPEMTFTGTLANINTALDNTVFTPTMGFTGAATITITSDDQGNTGAGGAKMDTDNLLVQVVPPLYHALANGSFTQNWSNTGLITVDNNWTIVPSIRGHRGDNLASSGDDAQTKLGDGSLTPLNVIANQSMPDTNISGGIAEFDGLANPVVALQGSGTADAPHLIIHVNSIGTTGVRLKFNAIDVDGSADDAAQQVAVQWRVGNSGNYTNVPAAYIADATDPGTTGKTTAVDVVLPGAATNQPDLQIRIITVDAIGPDEWVGIDDIEVLQGVGNPNQVPVNKVPSTQFTDMETAITFSSITFNGISTSDPDAGGGEVKINLKAANGKLSLSGTTGLTFLLGDGTSDPEMTFTGILADVNTALEGSSYLPNTGFTATDTITLMTDDQGNTGGPAQTDTDSFNVTINPIIEGSYHDLFNAALLQDWSNIGLISANDDWSMVPSIIGFRGDNLILLSGTDPQTVTATGNPPTIDVIANAVNPDTLTTGGVAEFDTLANPTVALQGSGTAEAPHLTFYLNTLNVTNVKVQYDLIDIDGSVDNSAQQVALQYRIGAKGAWTNVPAGYIADATDGPSLTGKTSNISVTLPAAVEGQAKVQVRVITTNATTDDEWVAVDNINISATPGAGTPAKVTKIEVNDGVSAQRSMVTSLKVFFNQTVTFIGDPDTAFTLDRQGGGSVVVDANPAGSTATLTFVGGAVSGKSLINGLYNLTIKAANVGGAGLDGDGNGTGGDNYSLIGATANGLYRLFGDEDGDGVVTADDFSALRQVFGTSNFAFDGDEDGNVDSDDFAQFRTTFGINFNP